MYRLIRLTSRPLRKKHYSIEELMKPVPQEKTPDVRPEVFPVQEPEEDKISEVLNVTHEQAEVLESEQLAAEMAEAIEEENTKKKKKKKKGKKKKEGKFSIWEEVSDDPRDERQIEAAQLINQDGYYDTLEPWDIHDHQKEKMEFNWKIPAVILGGVAGLAASFFMIFYL